ncbi:cytochrome P450 [Pseudoclavibacter chungangensis]|uniref:cytochrome P450 n=1 Tax=Pseudoclavibacter chungangensis TaxID=587635 RepID=UPI0017D3619E|nr:cytochrome P450 [Pseudoclavibacter chungangensis]NYJ66581.1 cytochrome P450 [Pseudoclavibacter chungangensis]
MSRLTDRGGVRSTGTAPRTASNLHRVHEERVFRAAHPVAYPLLCRIRVPVLRVPGVGVVVRDTRLIRRVLLDGDTFDKTGPGSPADLWTPILGPSVLLNMEGADHASLRRKLAPLFTPSAVAHLADAGLAPLLADAVRRLRGGETVDVVALARSCASRLIAELAGLPQDTLDDELFARITRITGMVRLTSSRFSPRQVGAARSILADLTTGAATAYRAGDESTVPGRMRQLGLSEREALGAVGAFVLTGTETLVAFIPRLVAILVDSGWFERLRAELELRDELVQEGLRVTTPSPVMLRSVRGPSTLGDVAVRRGDRLVLANFLANRGPGDFAPGRGRAAGQKQLWFGAGPHFCLGAPLALAQIARVLDALVEGTADGPAEVTARRPARGVLIPGYRELLLRRADGARP